MTGYERPQQAARSGDKLDLTYMTFHRGIDDPDAAGGFTTVVEDQASKGPEANKHVRFLTSDTRSGEIAGVNVLAALPETREQNMARTNRFFAGVWPLLHPTAYTAPSVPMDVLNAMYSDRRVSQHPVGSFERLLETVERYAPPVQIEKDFVQRYNQRINEIPSGSVMRWQDFFWVHGILAHADALRERGVHQSWHLHTSLPDTLSDSKWGRSFLEAVSKVDEFFVHTDVFKARVEKQLEELGLRIPEVKRYDLGVERAKLDQRLALINPGNFESAIPGYQTLGAEQQAFLKELYSTQETVPHRFLVVCRFDPIKGLDVVLRSIDTFLQERQASGEDLKKNYRFYFVNKIFDYGEVQEGNLSQAYAIYLSQQFRELHEKYPGVIFRGDAMTGPQRVAIPSMMRNCHGITGGRDEGLSLAIQENAWINRDRDTSIICGTGAGIAQKVIGCGFGDSAYFPDPGEPLHFVAAMHDIVKRQRETIGNLKERKSKMVEGVLSKSNASMIHPGQNEY